MHEPDADEYPTMRVDLPSAPAADPSPETIHFAPAPANAFLDGEETDSYRTAVLVTPPPLPPVAREDAASLLLASYLGRYTPDDGHGSEARSARRSGGPASPSSFGDLIRPENVMRSLSGPSDGSLPAGRLPTVGAKLFKYVLKRELGKGAFARVFQADETDLGNRPVVVKVSGVEGREPQTLASLQHTHIVPVYALHEDARTGVRALVMPYFGGASLSQTLHAVWHGRTGSPPTAGAELMAAVDRVSPPPLCEASPAAGPPCDQTPRGVLDRLDYVRACAWVTARLAEGLGHAHGHGVLHRDIKPANVLLTGDGVPMLLDFNLAQDVRAEKAHATLGGTVAYMSPEQLRAMADRDPVAARNIDHRSDLYALGMVLREMLTGLSPVGDDLSRGPLPLIVSGLAVERAKAAPSARAARPDVPWGLESIITKCLAPAPADRYQKADDLAEDLRRFLDDRPLRFAPELSVREVARKWSRRHPRLAVGGLVSAAAAVLLGGVGLTLLVVHGLYTDNREQLLTAQADERKTQYQEGAVHALFLVNTRDDLSDHLRDGAAACEQTLGTYRVLDDADWQNHPDLKRLSAADRVKVLDDTRELLVLLAHARVRLAPPGDKAAALFALALLDKADAIAGLPPCRAVWDDRADYRGTLGDAAGAAAARKTAARIEPATARDFYLTAMSASRTGRYAEAVERLDRAIRLNPRDYWSWTQRGLCHDAMGEPMLAVGDYGTCIGLRPDFAWGYYNRGCALGACGKGAEAVTDYTAALTCDPSLSAALFNRAMHDLDLERNAAALADFDLLIARGRDDARMHAGRAVALERLGRHADADKAFALTVDKAADLPADARTYLRWTCGFAVADRKPAEARAAFDDVLAKDPYHPQALYGVGMLLERRDRLSLEAVNWFDRAIAASPLFVPPHRAKAKVLARRGRLREAGDAINVCLEREPRSGPTLYAAACVAALAAGQSPPDAARPAADQAVDLLRRAFDQKYGPDKAGDDIDLKSIHDDPRFKRLLTAAGVKPVAD